MANGQFIIPGSSENDALRRSVEEAYQNTPVNEIDHPTQKRVDEIIDNYSVYAVEQALEAADKRNASDGFDQILAENPELYGLVYDVAEGVGLDAELDRVSAKPDVLKGNELIKTPLKQRVFGIILEKPDFAVSLVNAEGKIAGEKFFGANSRFWYFEGDWFFEQNQPNVGYQVIRYQIAKQNMHKLYEGKEYYFSAGEKTTLVKAIMRYRTDVLEPLYGNKPSKPALGA
jgi:hypothetical protein